jgi:hypothetical protein
MFALGAGVRGTATISEVLARVRAKATRALNADVARVVSGPGLWNMRLSAMPRHWHHLKARLQTVGRVQATTLKKSKALAEGSR